MTYNDLSKETAADMARDMLCPANSPVVFDTETTGLGSDAQIVQIACVDAVSGAVLLDTLVRPTCGVEPEAFAVHGISDDMLASAPAAKEVLPLLLDTFNDKLALAYNFDYDRRMLVQTLRAAAAPWPERWASWFAPPILTHCIMQVYAQYRGDWNDYWLSFSWHKLVTALQQCNLNAEGKLHSALGDVQASLAVLRHMAST